MEVKELEEKLEEYLDELEYIKNLSPQTIKNYNASIGKFIKYLKKEKIEKLDNLLNILKKYIIYLKKNKKNLQSSINTHITNIAIFFNHLDISINTKKLIGKDKNKNKPPKYLESEEIDEIIATIPKNNIRDKTIILTLYHTGLRVSELTNLNKNDIKPTDNFKVFKINVKEGKGGKYRITFLDKQTYELIQKMIYKRTRKGRSESENAPLFQSNKMQRISVRSIQTLVKKYAIIADKKRIENGLETKFEDLLSPHTLRHSYTINLLNNNNKPINMVQKLLGHSSIQTTQIYSNVGIDKIKDDYQNVNW
ncbi:tyrosine recombinase XerC [Methanobrevibacter cuticularis]|uniref:Tyrosine recombinase XerC n=1 Tax=Methanobrevibacter cuticularis TaxID=47311 RepID=A0A166DJ03_9EURY|nr:tyrosine-type recombinase/integrase [Methanobrevibacter cuticularis]KZX15648.1 tyrosine recombinase XerC [Methanobrevibacter cuticularis]